jgi:hypothetical protein
MTLALSKKQFTVNTNAVMVEKLLKDVHDQGTQQKQI